MVLSQDVFVLNHPDEGPGYLGDLFRRDGLDDTICRSWIRMPEPPYRGPVVVLGGPNGANDNLPHLRAQERMIRHCFERDVPLLGVCLGAQLAARALGGSVRRGNIREVGFYRDVVVDRTSKLFWGAPHPYTVFHWHDDTFEVPPEGIVLARSNSYRNQAFACGSVVGLQFHLEPDHSTMERWLRIISSRDSGVTGIGYLDRNMEELRRNMEGFHAGFRKAFAL